jgi:hypothetical protein
MTPGRDRAAIDVGPVVIAIALDIDRAAVAVTAAVIGSRGVVATRRVVVAAPVTAAMAIAAIALRAGVAAARAAGILPAAAILRERRRGCQHQRGRDQKSFLHCRTPQTRRNTHKARIIDGPPSGLCRSNAGPAEAFGG